MIAFSSVFFLKIRKQYPRLPFTQPPNFQMFLKQKGEKPPQHFLFISPLAVL